MFKIKMASHSNTFKPMYGSNVSENVQFKPWLIEQISSGRYPGLEWIDAEKQRVFKLPWTKKNYPGWEDHHKIFKAWAEHRAFVRNLKPPEQHVSLMKSNFRTILRKCRDLEEQTNLHQLGLQTGNYKVYKVLTPMETAARKGREKMVKQGEVEQEVEEFGADIVDVEILSDGDMAGWIPDVHTIPADWGSLKISTALNMGVIHNHQAGGKRGASPTLETDSTPKKKAMVKFQRPLLMEEETKITDVDFTPKEVVFLRGATLTQAAANEEDFDPRSSEQHPEDAMNNHQEELDAREIQKEEEVAEEDADGFKMLLHAAELSAGPQREIPPSKDEPSSPDIQQILDLLNIPHDVLNQYSIQVRYQQHDVLEQELARMDLGYRVHYGDPDQQAYLDLVDEPQRSELIVDFERITIRLPEVKSIGNRGQNGFQKVLQNVDAGLVLTHDNNSNLVCKRLCASRVFAISSYGAKHSDKEPIKLERDLPVVLFNLNLFLLDWLQCLKNPDNRPVIDHTMHLSLGKKTETRKDKTFIGIKLVPKVSETLLSLLPSSDCESLDNNAKSFERILQLVSTGEKVSVV